MIHTRTEDNQFEPWRGLRSRRYKYVRNEKGPWLLYDLERDPFEMTNLVEEAAHRGLVKRLDGEVARQMRRIGDRWDVLEHRPYR
jgi:arylsulfatase A-like enzyme